MNKFPDIYFLPQWAKLHEEKDNGRADVFLFENQFGKIYYQFIKRPIEMRINGNTYFDIITPYGFNGPIILENYAHNKEQLLQDWFCAFTTYCDAEKIIAEYVRFSPWLQNYTDFEKYYDFVSKKHTLAINLEGDFFMQEFSNKCRNRIKKSIKSDVLIEFDYEGKTLDEFISLYDKTVTKNHINEYYQMSLDFFTRMFKALKGNIFLINARFDGHCISSAIFLHYGDYIHYHFCGNDYAFSSLSPNNYILFEACNWGRTYNKKKLHLGGDANDENLLHFKKTFTKNGIHDFFIGKSIRNKEIYQKLIEIMGESHTDYFPAYRG